MKGFKSTVALITTIVMMFSLTACSKKPKEYDKDSITSLLKDELKIDEDEIYVYDSDGENGSPEGTSVTAKYDDARIIVLIYDDADEANEAFNEAYKEFQDQFNLNDRFKGDFLCNNSDDYGYIVINGNESGVNVFGDIFATGSLYGGLYYSGSMITMVRPEGPDSFSGVNEVIEALGYPNV